MLPFNVETVVLCDEIRQENNGKYLLIGVYGANILVRNFPVDLRLSLWILGNPNRAGKEGIRFRVVGISGTKLVEGEFQMDVKDAGGGAIFAIGGLPVQLQSEGAIKFEIAPHRQDEWTTIKSVDVKLAPRAKLL